MDQDGPDAVAFLEHQHQEVLTAMSSLAAGHGDRRETFEMLVRLLAVHESAEEMVVYPAVRASVPDGDALADARLREEDDAKQALSDLEKLGVDDPRFDETFETFAAAVREHADHEEREVFPKLRAHVDPEMLDRMRAALVTAEAVAPTHPHPHGPNSAIGNLVVGPFVAIADRVRDALRSVSR